jgi:hypothetical protein
MGADDGDAGLGVELYWGQAPGTSEVFAYYLLATG